MAIEHGVELYILKPATPMEIASCMAQMICEIHDSKKNEETKKQMTFFMCGFFAVAIYCNRKQAVYG